MRNRVYEVGSVDADVVLGVTGHPRLVRVHAEGRVATSGWTQPSLDHWVYIRPPQDGILDLDFTALQPTGYVIQVVSDIKVTITFPIPSWVKGVRVHSSSGSVEALLEGSMSSEEDETETLAAVPWPFPWWAPDGYYTGNA